MRIERGNFLQNMLTHPNVVVARELLKKNECSVFCAIYTAPQRRLRIEFHSKDSITPLTLMSTNVHFVVNLAKSHLNGLLFELETVNWLLKQRIIRFI